MKAGKNCCISLHYFGPGQYEISLIPLNAQVPKYLLSRHLQKTLNNIRPTFKVHSKLENVIGSKK